MDLRIFVPFRMNVLSAKGIFTSKISVLSSEFIAYITFCESTEQLQIFQKQLRTEHPKATHHCLAYRIGTESLQEFASDDGEPSGTAGLPMLNVLKHHQLIQVCACVVRYFGGTKLGKKGLIETYRNVLEQVITKIGIKPIEKRLRFTIRFEYDFTNEVNKWIHSYRLSVEQESYDSLVQICVSLPFNDADTIYAQLQSLAGNKAQLSEPEFFYE